MASKNPPGRNSRRPVKRPAPPVFTAVPSSCQEKDNDILWYVYIRFVPFKYFFLQGSKTKTIVV